MAKSKSYFGDYTMSGVFGGKPSARSRKRKQKDFAEFGSLTIPALALVGYMLYKRSKNTPYKPTDTTVASK